MYGVGESEVVRKIDNLEGWPGEGQWEEPAKRMKINKLGCYPNQIRTMADETGDVLGTQNCVARFCTITIYHAL